MKLIVVKKLQFLLYINLLDQHENICLKQTNNNLSQPDFRSYLFLPDDFMTFHEELFIIGKTKFWTSRFEIIKTKNEPHIVHK